MTRTSSIAVLTLVAAAGLLTAGPLNPPAGPVESTYQTLSEIEPRVAVNLANTPGDADSTYKITSNGSYYLTGDVITAPGKMGIEIAADDVTLDLNGFRVGGYPGALKGIKATGTTRRNITIKHGSIWTMSGGGISLKGDDGQGTGCRVMDVSIRDCGGDGLDAGQQALLERIDASNNSGAGIVAGQGSTLTACTAGANGDFGISVGSGSTITACS